MDVEPLTLTMAPNGRLVIPSSVRSAMGLRNGGRLVARVVNDGLVLESQDAAIRRAQALVRQYIPNGEGMVDELIAERRAEAARD